MIRKISQRFLQTRRSAVAITFAVSILPLILLVGIAIDFTLLSQARSQATFAAEAAANHAVRVAVATYAVEVQDGSSTTVANSSAIAAGNDEGNQWFDAELGGLTYASIATRSTNTTSTIATSNPPNFTAAVSYTFHYPPIFDPIFGNPTPYWAYASSATATSQFSYAQILMMIDTSGSMLIGANPSDVLTMEENSVCPKQGYYLPTAGDSYTTAGLGELSYNPTGTGFDPTPPSNDGDSVDLRNAFNYPAKSGTDTSEQCNSNYGVGGASYNAYLGDGVYPPPDTSEAATQPAVDCALACHSTTKTANDGNYADLYGIARRNNVLLRLDVVLQAAENVISTMSTIEKTSNQFAVGVFQFNADVLPMVNSTTGTTATNSPPEATTDLTNALAMVKSYDYTATKTETKLPLLTENSISITTPFSKSATFNASPEQANANGVTNFIQSMADLQAGDASPTSSSGKLQPLTAAGDGSQIQTPEKFIFIITDGLEDTNTLNGGGEVISGVSTNVAGTMTSIAGEKAGTGTCSALKNLGYVVYVLYIDYYPMDDNSYYANLTNIGRSPSLETLADYPNDTSSNTSISSLTEVTSLPASDVDSKGNELRYTTSPTALALQACASSPVDFYAASSSSQITTALNDMLQSAVASTTRLTN